MIISLDHVYIKMYREVNTVNVLQQQCNGKYQAMQAEQLSYMHLHSSNCHIWCVCMNINEILYK